MPETTHEGLGGVAETLLIPLYTRAVESQRSDAILRDDRAVALVAQMGYDFSRIKQIKMGDDVKNALVLRNREFDRYARDFMVLHPDAVVVHSRRSRCRCRRRRDKTATTPPLSRWGWDPPRSSRLATSLSRPSSSLGGASPSRAGPGFG